AAGTLAVGAWLILARLAAAGGLSPGVAKAAVAAAILARAAAIGRDPAFSDDVFRYVFEGRVVWSAGPLFPLLHAPAEAPALGVPAALLDASWQRINHPELPTIYPPFAGLVFAAAGGLGELAGGGHLRILKLLLVLADL